jgi:hypothetical protein
LEQFFMLRICLRMCQGVVVKSRAMNRHWEWHATRTAESCSICLSGAIRIHDSPFPSVPATEGGMPRSILPSLSPINFSTTVPLTPKVPKSTLIGIEHCPTYQGRRKLIETMGREGVYRLGTGS